MSLRSLDGADYSYLPRAQRDGRGCIKRSVAKDLSIQQSGRSSMIDFFFLNQYRRMLREEQ
jgi:hypothetical protein